LKYWLEVLLNYNTAVGPIDKVLLQTNPGCTSRFLTSQTFLIYIIW